MSYRIFGLVGRTLGHSFSPSIHSSLGCIGYRLHELEPSELGAFITRPDLGGINVTIPYKKDVMPYCDFIDAAAREIGAVNTIVRRGGMICAYNTDKYGFEYAVGRAGLDFQGKKVVILGSGGTSRTAKAASMSLGAHEIVIISRGGENNYGNISRHSDADIIVNTTPVGMYPDCPASPVSLDMFPKCTGVMDVVYNPLRTGLLMDAERRGIPHTGGLAMLVAQAKASEEIFFNKHIDDSRIDEITDKLCRDAANIVIIGMPGSGKTTVGKFLSRLSGRALVDMDKFIKSREGVSPSDIITERGEAEFRRIETAAIAEVSKSGGKIITTGGGAVVREENYPLLHQNGRIYCLERAIEELSTRGRPLSSNGIEGLRAMYAVRRPLYERFMDVSVQNNGALEDTAMKIWSDFCENTRY